MSRRKPDRVEIYRSKKGWRWRRKAANGEIVSQGQAYTRRADAKRGATRANSTFGGWEWADPRDL